MYKYNTCDLGTPEYNYDLSVRRAKAARNFLVKNFHLSYEQFEIKGLGLTQPLVPNTDEASRAKNRRAVIVNTMKSFTRSERAKPEKAIIRRAETPATNAPISVQVKKLISNIPDVLQEGDILTHEDNYAIEFKPRSPLYVYVYLADDKGEIYQFFPNADYSSEKNPVAPESYRIPQNPLNWLYLDKDTGKEHIILLAAKRALQEPEKVCMEQLNLSPYEDGVKLASASGTPKDRGWKGVRPKYQVTPPQEQEIPKQNIPKQVTPKQKISEQETPEDLFVWKRYFIHK